MAHGSLKLVLDGTEYLILDGPSGTTTTAAVADLIAGGSFPTATGSGSPEGVVTGAVSSSYVDTTAHTLYYKASGTGNTGWVLISGFPLGPQDDGTNTYVISASGGLLRSSNVVDGSGEVARLDLVAAAGFIAASLVADDNVSAVAQITPRVNGGAASVRMAISGNVIDVIVGTGDPNGLASAPIGSPFFQTDTAALWLNTDGATAWSKRLGGVPTNSHTATVAFGSLTIGTPKQNTLGYDILVTCRIPVTAAVSGAVAMGVGPSSTPTTDSLTGTLSAATTVDFSAVVPSGYYLSVAQSGTITLGTPTLVVTPL